MAKAFIFPGQGSQDVGMGKALADNFTAARDVFTEIDDALGEKLSDIMPVVRFASASACPWVPPT